MQHKSINTIYRTCYFRVLVKFNRNVKQMNFSHLIISTCEELLQIQSETITILLFQSCSDLKIYLTIHSSFLFLRSHAPSCIFLFLRELKIILELANMHLEERQFV